MAGRIAGITVEIGGDTTKLQSALKGVDKQLKSTQSNLKDINKLLKLDPGNTELLTQKQKNLQNAIKATKDRLAELKNAQSQVKQGTEEWDALQREIIATEQDLKNLEKEYREFGSVSAQQIKAAGQSMQEFGNKVQAAGNALKPVSAAAGAFVTSIVGAGYKAVTTADDLNTLAKQTGLTTEEIQKMQYASDLIDVKFEDITGALQKMKPKMDESNASFAALGVSVTDADGNLRSVDAVFYDTIKALSGIQNETRRDQLAMELFGRSADSLAGVIDDGGAALQEYGDKAKAMGLILSQDTLDSLNATNDKVDEMKANLRGAFLGLGATAAEGLAPLVGNIALVVEKVTSALQKLTPEQLTVITTIAATVAAIAPLLIVGGKLITGIGMLMTFAPKVMGAFTAFNPAVLGIIAAVAALVAIGVALYKNWDKITDWWKTNVVAKFKQGGEELRQDWENIRNKATETWNNITTTVSEKATAISDMAKNKLDNIKRAFEENGGGIRGVAAATWQAVKERWTLGFDAINALTGGKLDGIRNKISSAFDSIRAIVQNAVDKLKSIMNFSWSLPHIRMPHFSVTGGFSLNPPRAPHFSVSWYRKAYDNPIMFTSPTVVNTPAGMKGFGDGHGAEIVMGLDKLRQLVGGMGSVNITVIQQPWQDAKELAREIQAVFVQEQQQRGAAQLA